MYDKMYSNFYEVLHLKSLHKSWDLIILIGQIELFFQLDFFSFEILLTINDLKK